MVVAVMVVVMMVMIDSAGGDDDGNGGGVGSPYVAQVDLELWVQVLFLSQSPKRPDLQVCASRPGFKGYRIAQRKLYFLKNKTSRLPFCNNIWKIVKKTLDSIFCF